MQIGDPRASATLFTITAMSAALMAGRAEAQFGYGYGGFGGYGFGFNYQPPEIGFINQKSLLNASQATMGPVQNNAYANNPNSYFNHLHDDGLLDRYDVGTRRSIEASVGRYSDGPPPSRTPPPTSPGVAAAPPPPPPLPLSGFFDRYQKLVWPDFSPTFGPLATARTTSDQASLAVFNEYNICGLALVSTVTDARSKLLDYGRPALKYVRENTTPRVADGFHLFLLSLYESLAQAATIPKPATPSAGAAQPKP